MDEIYFCRLADAFTLTDAAALIIGEPPNQVRVSEYDNDVSYYMGNENNGKFKLTDDEGNLINQAIEDCSKVANWNPGGGAPKTPG